MLATFLLSCHPKGKFHTMIQLHMSKCNDLLKMCDQFSIDKSQSHSSHEQQITSSPIWSGIVDGLLILGCLATHCAAGPMNLTVHNCQFLQRYIHIKSLHGFFVNAKNNLVYLFDRCYMPHSKIFHFTWQWPAVGWQETGQNHRETFTNPHGTSAHL